MGIKGLLVRSKCEGGICLLLLVMLLLMPASLKARVTSESPIFTPPPNYMTLVYGRTDGPPATVDPAWSGDSASNELIFNTYETLFTFDGEHVDRYIPQLASAAIRLDINETSPEGLNWTCRYVFPIQNTTINFNPTESYPSVYTLSPEDVEYSFERAMIYNRAPETTYLYGALTNTSGAYYLIALYGNATAGRIIDHAVESNATHVWFNLVNVDVTLPQFASSLAFGVISKTWMHDYVVGILGRPDWNGDWGDYTSWPQYYYALGSPLDSPTPLMCGTGPYKLSIIDNTMMYYTLTRNTDYWRGWPADWPNIFGTRPAGYVNSFTVSWDGNLTKFLTGEDDLYDVPVWSLGQVVGQPGVRFYSYPLPTFDLWSTFFQFHVPIDSRYQKVYPPGIFAGDGIPTDFFGNDTWGIHTRRAFAYSFNFTDYMINIPLGWNASQPATPVLPGVPYWNESQEKYKLNLTRVALEFQQVPELWQTGFDMVLIYNVGDPVRLAILTNLKSNIERLNPLFHLEIVPLVWWQEPPKPSCLDAIIHKLVAVVFPHWDSGSEPVDPHYFLCQSMNSLDNWGGYNNTYVDSLLDMGPRTTDPNLRNLIYGELQSIYHNDVPSFPIAQLYTHRVERDWVVDRYYNPAGPGEYSIGSSVYAYNLWKWYYLPGDVNYDGKIDMRDIGLIARSFGATYSLPLDPRWNFRCDLDHNGIIDMKDIGKAARGFGQTSPPWSPVWPP